MDLTHIPYGSESAVKQELSHALPERVITNFESVDRTTDTKNNVLQKTSLENEVFGFEGHEEISFKSEINLNHTIDIPFEIKECTPPNSFATQHKNSDINEINDGEGEFQAKFIKQDEIEIDSIDAANENIFVCSICGEMYETKKELIDHKKQNEECHEHKICEKCQIKSEEGFTCIWDLMQHLEIEHQMEHQEDLNLFEIRKASSKQMTGSVEDPHTCDICHKSFYSKYTLRTHQMVHTGQKPFQCGICSTFCSTRSTLKVHELTHSKKKPFQCSFSPRSFSFKYKWSQHERTHTAEEPFKCQGCDRSIANEQELREHERTPSEGETIRCRFCCKTFAYASKHMEHERLHTGEKPFQCEFCDKRFSLRSTAKNHQRTHTGERPYVCRFCQQTFSFSASWRVHELSHAAKNIPCGFCSKTFSCAESAKRHEIVHLRKTELKHHCAYCEKSYHKRWDLLAHEKKHTHPHVCDTCKKRFADAETLREHHQVTRNSRNFTCGVCYKSYGNQSNLIRHMIKHK